MVLLWCNGLDPKFRRSRGISLFARYWSAATTKFGEEQRAAHHVERQGFEFYLPRIVTRYGASVRHEYLFPGYIFVMIERGWESLMSTRGIRRVFMCGDVPTRMKSSDINSMRSQEDESGYIVLQPPVTVGSRVRVCDGSFKDLLGTVQNMSARDRCTVLLSVMERSVPVSLSLGSVEAVPQQ